MSWYMLRICLVGLLMLATVDGKVCGDDLARYAFTVHAGKYMKGHNYLTEYNTDAEECRRICATATWGCRSFDYLQKQCYLQNQTMQSAPDAIKDSKSYAFNQVHCEVTYLRSPSSSPIDIHQPANFNLEVRANGMKTYQYGVAIENAWNGALKDVNSCAQKCSEFVNEKGNCMKFTFNIDDSKCYLFNGA